MSGTLSSCCPSVVYDVLPCRNPCTFNPLNCTDPISIAIQAILNLRQRYGSSAPDILTESLVICPDYIINQCDVDDALHYGTRRGIFSRIVRHHGDEPTYMVNARMALFNYENRKYARYPCTTGSFWKCGRHF
jgi:hypothetical protein